MVKETEHRGWHYRGYLPHYDGPELVQTVSFRLADAVPAHLLERWREELLCTDEPGDRVKREELRRRVEKYEDAGYGECQLRDPRVAEIVENAILWFHDRRYRMIAWVVMPNHVHAMFEVVQGWPLHKILHSWKSFTSSRINSLLGRNGPLWFRDYFDRFIRDTHHYETEIFYIENNPVAAGLCSEPEDWLFSSARRRVLAQGDPGRADP